jgi:hypothetical protein
MTRRQLNFKSGRLSAEEKAAVERLATTLKHPTPSAIANRLNRRVSTISWFMITRGLIVRKIKYPKSPKQWRNGHNFYTQEHDQRLLALRLQGLGFLELSLAITAEFGIPRNRHSVHNRLIMLAAYDYGEEEDEACA